MKNLFTFVAVSIISLTVAISPVVAEHHTDKYQGKKHSYKNEHHNKDKNQVKKHHADKNHDKKHGDKKAHKE